MNRRVRLTVGLGFATLIFGRQQRLGRHCDRAVVSWNYDFGVRRIVEDQFAAHSTRRHDIAGLIHSHNLVNFRVSFGSAHAESNRFGTYGNATHIRFKMDSCEYAPGACSHRAADSVPLGFASETDDFARSRYQVLFDGVQCHATKPNVEGNRPADEMQIEDQACAGGSG